MAITQDMSHMKTKENPATIVFRTEWSNGYKYDKEDAYLYQNRVSISYRYGTLTGWHLTVCGYEIMGFEDFGNLNIHLVADILNQIEQLGIDAFLANYKAKVEEYRLLLKQEERETMDKLSLHEDDNLKKTLANTRNKLSQMLVLIFMLSLHIPCGIDNTQYENAYQAIVAQYNLK